MSDLQLALLALGAVFVAAVFGYNILQERKARKRAEATFRAPSADPLLDPAADRREPTIGAVPEEEIAACNDTVAGFAASINGVSQRESPALAAARARELDRFCAEADFEVAVNVRTGPASPFGVTRVKALALEHGYAERGDGSFERRLPDGLSSTTLRFADPDAGGKAWVQGLTFALDVPLVPKPHEALAELAATAGEFAQVLGGELVDDARKPLGPAGIAAIRRSLEQVSARMDAQGIPAGGALARRLFA